MIDKNFWSNFEKNTNLKFLLRILLFPFAILYDGITRLRNKAYDSQKLRSISFESTLITVGNLTVGGTGKTPHVEYLIRLVQNKFKTATLSRGYGRKTKGVIIADKTATAQKIADEPMQFYLKYGNRITVAVGESRLLAIPEIVFHQPDNEVILLDDAFQHRAVLSDFQILLSDFHRPFYQDFVLPAGRLRESRSGAKRADMIIVSKCPENLEIKQKKEIQKHIEKYCRPNTPIFFTGIRYLTPVSFSENFQKISSKIILLTGIAQTKSLEEKLSENFEIIEHLRFPDHADYTPKRLKIIRQTFEKLSYKHADLCILTTEKDFVKLKTPDLKEFWESFPFFYLPIEIYFLDNSNEFNKLILNVILEKINLKKNEKNSN